MKYLKNIVNKCIHINKKVESLHCRIDNVEVQLAEVRETTMKLGKACSKAFDQTKEVIQHLGETAEETREEIAEYGGLIVEHSDWYSN